MKILRTKPTNVANIEISFAPYVPSPGTSGPTILRRQNATFTITSVTGGLQQDPHDLSSFLVTAPVNIGFTFHKNFKKHRIGWVDIANLGNADPSGDLNVPKSDHLNPPNGPYVIPNYFLGASNGVYSYKWKLTLYCWDDTDLPYLIDPDVENTETNYLKRRLRG